MATIRLVCLLLMYGTVFESGNSTDVFQTCAGNNVFSIILINETRTWSQALQSCKAFQGYNLDFLNIDWPKVKPYSQYFREINHQLPVTLWSNSFRPHEAVDSWFEAKSSGCVDSELIEVTDYSADEQCLAVRFENYFDKPVYIPTVCTQKLVYSCYQSVGGHSYDYLSSYKVLERSDGLKEYRVSGNYSSCEDFCIHRGNCGAFTFNHNTDTCITQRFKSGYAKANYTVIHTPAGNFTHGIQNGCYNISYEIEITDVTTNVTSAFPDCQITTVPTGYCECGGVSEEIFLQMLENITVSRKDTAKARRKLVCAEDTRTSSSVIGWFGVCICVAVAFVVVAPDIVQFVGEIWQAHLQKTKVGVQKVIR